MTLGEGYGINKRLYMYMHTLSCNFLSRYISISALQVAYYTTSFHITTAIKCGTLHSYVFFV